MFTTSNLTNEDGPTVAANGTRLFGRPTLEQRAAERGRVDGILVANGIERAPWPMESAAAERAYLDARASHYRTERDRQGRFGPTLPDERG